MPTIISGMNPISIYSTELNYMTVVTLSGKRNVQSTNEGVMEYQIVIYSLCRESRIIIA